MTATLSAWLWLIVVSLLVGAAVSWRRRSRVDIQWPVLEPELQWDTPPDESLKKIYAYVVALSTATIQWYQTRRQPKRIWGVSLRLGALLLTALAGLVPLTQQIGMTQLNPVWSTVMLAAAGVFVSVDVFAGFTSGWVRYMLAQQKVERLRDAFLFEWNSLKVAKTDTHGMLERAKTFVLAVGNVVDDETQEWASEFQNALKEMEKARKAAAEVERVGAVEVTLKNPQAVNEWIFEIDGSQRGRTSGKNLAVTDVAVGIRKLKAYGDDPHGKRLSDEKTVKVEGGATVAKELELT